MIENFKFKQILEIARRSNLPSSKEDLYFCMCRHLVNTQQVKEETGFNSRDIRTVLNNDLNDDLNIEKMLEELVTEGYIEVKSKKFYVK